MRTLQPFHAYANNLILSSHNRVKFSNPDEFYTELAKLKEHLPTWIGELYLELHNGTYTTMAKVEITHSARAGDDSIKVKSE